MSKCQHCGACCQVLNYDCKTRSQVEYFRARGFKILQGQAWIRYPCPNFEYATANIDGLCRCRIHNTKPLLCRLFKEDSEECKRARKMLEVKE